MTNGERLISQIEIQRILLRVRFVSDVDVRHGSYFVFVFLCIQEWILLFFVLSCLVVIRLKYSTNSLDTSRMMCGSSVFF